MAAKTKVKNPLQQASSTPNRFATRRGLQNSSTLYTKYLLHHTPLAPNNLYAKYPSQGIALAQEDLNTILYTPSTLYNTKLLHQKPFRAKGLTPKNHETPHTTHPDFSSKGFRPEKNYTRSLLHQQRFYIKHLLHQILEA